MEQSGVTETQFVSNRGEDSILGDLEFDFHQDQLIQENPLKALILCGMEFPTEGGETSFVHTTRSMTQCRNHCAGGSKEGPAFISMISMGSIPGSRICKRASSGSRVLNIQFYIANLTQLPLEYG